MKPTECQAPLPLETLVDYTAGDLAADREAQVEEHYFACGACARRLAAVEALGRGVSALVRRGAARASVSAELIERLDRAGLAVRRYRLAPGDTVPCTAAPDDDFVLVELATGSALPAGAAVVDVLAEDLARGGSELRTLHVGLDRERCAISLLFPAQAVRAYPRSRWTMHVRFERNPEPRLGAYVLEHTPWDELAARGEAPR